MSTKLPNAQIESFVEHIEVAVLEALECALESCVYQAHRQGLSDRQLRELAAILVRDGLKRVCERSKGGGQDGE